MSDPFDAFESNLVATGESAPPASSNGVVGGGGAFDDPAAEFLAREKAEMAKIESNNQFTDDGFGDFGGGDLASAKQTKPETFSSGFGSSNDIFGTTNGTNGQSTAQVNGSDSSHSLDSKTNQDWEVVDEKKEPERNDLYSAIHSMDKLSVEPEKIKRWREEQKIRLETKDAEEEQKKKEWKEAAKKELDDWYKNRADQLKKTHENNKSLNKSAETELVSDRDSTNAQTWDKVAKLCEFNPKANKNVRDVGRMRSILLQLKQQPLVR